MKAISHKFPTKRSAMPVDLGHKKDPTHKEYVKKVGGTSCPGGIMRDKIKLPISHNGPNLETHKFEGKKPKKVKLDLHQL